MVRLKPQILFSLLVVIFFGYLVWAARDWRIEAKIFPWSIGIPMLFLSVVQFIREVRGELRKAPPGETPVDFQFTKEIDPVVARRRTMKIFSWILGFLAGVWLFGFSLTIPVVVFCFLKFQSSEPWGLSLVLTAAAWFIFWGLFDRLLLLPLPEGEVFLWLEW